MVIFHSSVEIPESISYLCVYIYIYYLWVINFKATWGTTCYLLPAQVHCGAGDVHGLLRHGLRRAGAATGCGDVQGHDAEEVGGGAGMAMGGTWLEKQTSKIGFFSHRNDRMVSRKFRGVKG